MENEKISNKLRSIIHNLSSLPTLPVVASRVLALLQNPNVPMEELARLISSDQSLTARVLRLVNSSYYGFPRQISTVKHALTILGFNEIKNLVFTVSILRTFSRKDEYPLFDWYAFWKHSLGTAVVAKMLAKFFRYRISGKVFVAGLIHDIGKIVMCYYAQDIFKIVMEKVEELDISFYEAEKRTIKLTHAEVGAWLARWWNLPQDIEETIGFHHRPDLAKFDRSLCAVVCFADALVRAKSIGWSGDGKIVLPHPEVWEILGKIRPDFDSSHMDFLLTLVESEIEKATPLFKIIK